MLYLAIDQHSKQLTVNVRDEAGQVLRRKQVSTKGPAVEEFLAEVALKAGPDGYATIVEVCGFNEWLLDLLPRCGCREIVLVQPAKASRKKTDRRDANQLGELLWVNRQRLLARQRVQGLRRVNIPGVRERDHRRIVALRRRLVREVTRVTNRVRMVLRRRNLQHDCPTKSIRCQRARAWLKQLVLEPLDRLEIDHLTACWDLLERQRVALDAMIASCFAESKDAQLLRTIHGAGPYIALGLAAHVGDVSRFPRPRSLANYWGLTPTCHNSGERQQRLGSISKEGSVMARFLLSQVVLHILRRDPRMRNWYVGLRRRRGSKIARVAVMRRLANIVWHMLKHRQPYRLAAKPEEVPV